MKKTKLICLVTAVCFMLTAAACSTGGGDTSSQPAGESEATSAADIISEPETASRENEDTVTSDVTVSETTNSESGETVSNTEINSETPQKPDNITSERPTSAPSGNTTSTAPQTPETSRTPDGGNDEPDYHRYNLECFIKPVWEGDTVYNETLMFVPDPATGKIEPAPLLYKPDKVLAVLSSDLSKSYKEGADYIVTEDGRIALTEKTRIPKWGFDDFYRKKPDQSFNIASISVPGRYLRYAEGNVFLKTQVCVTYTHSDKWGGYVPTYEGSKLPKTMKKLTERKPLKIVYNGDSVCVGCNASGSSVVGVAPFVPSWADMLTAELKTVYGGNISAVNTAVGGTTSQWGIENVQKNVIDHNPDLVVIRFGTNDAQSDMTTATYKQNIENMIIEIRKANPDCEFILVANTLQNPDAQGWTKEAHTTNQGALIELSEKYSGVVVAKMLSVENYLLQHKRFYDLTGNNINHFNDFMTRVQAQAVAKLLVKDL